MIVGRAGRSLSAEATAVRGAAFERRRQHAGLAASAPGTYAIDTFNMEPGETQSLSVALSDVIATGETVFDPATSNGEKAFVASLFLVGLATSGGEASVARTGFQAAEWLRVRSLMAVRAHIDSASSNLQSYVIDREALAKWDKNLLNAIDDGLIAFDRRVVLVDIVPPGGEIRGKAVAHPRDIEQLRMMFENLLALRAAADGSGD